MELPPIARTVGVIALIGLVSEFAFSNKTKRIIWERDNGECQWEGCDRSKKNGDRLECAHIDHSRDNPNYNNPSNGRLLCTARHHLQDHIEREGENGLTIDQNRWAIDRLLERSEEP